MGPWVDFLDTGLCMAPGEETGTAVPLLETDGIHTIPHKPLNTCDMSCVPTAVLCQSHHKQHSPVSKSFGSKAANQGNTKLCASVMFNKHFPGWFAFGVAAEKGLEHQCNLTGWVVHIQQFKCLGWVLSLRCKA